MTARPRLLFLAQSLPYPPHSGVANRTLNVLRQLRHAFEIDLVAFSRANHQRDRAAREAAWHALRRVAGWVAEPTPIPNEQSTARRIWDHLRSVVSGRAYTYYEYESRDFANRLRAVLRARRPDLVHLDSLGDLHGWGRAAAVSGRRRLGNGRRRGHWGRRSWSRRLRICRRARAHLAGRIRRSRRGSRRLDLEGGVLIS